MKLRRRNKVEEKDPDKLFSTFYKKFNKIVIKHAPITKLSKRKAKQLSKPWITTVNTQFLYLSTLTYYQCHLCIIKLWLI